MSALHKDSSAPRIVAIRPMGVGDLGAVVQIHQAAFPGFFLTRMGPRFLRAYYAAVLEFPRHLALVAETDRPVGFAVGFTDAPEFYQFFAQRKRRLLPLMAIAVLRHPSLVLALLSNARRVETKAAASDKAAVEMSSLATLRPGGGVGGQLVEAFADAAAQAGGRSILLTTDAEGNAAVRQFYEKSGFVLEGHEQRGSRRLCRYRRALVAAG